MATSELFEQVQPMPPGGAELFYHVLFRPTATFRALGGEAPLGAAAVALVAVAAVCAFAFAPQGAGSVVLAFFVALGWLFLIWLLVTGPLFVLGRMAGGRGEVQPLMAGTALAFLPFLLIGPAAAFVGWGRGGRVLAAMLVLGAVLWWLRILQAVVRGAMELTSGQAVLAIVGAELLLAALPMTYLVLWVLTLVLVAG